jgi:hypothetical protein
MLKGSSLAPVASFMGFASMSYNNMEQEILNDPKLKDLPEYQKKLMTIPYAIGMGAVEKLFYGKLLRGEKSAITQKVMTGIINQSLKALPKNASLEAIEAAIKGDIKGNLPRLLRAIHTAGVVGAEEEMIQAGYELGLQKTANLLLGFDAFNTGKTMEDYMKTIVTNGAMGYLGGGIMGGTLRTVELVKTGKLDILNPQDYAFFKAVSSDDKLKTLFSEKVANDFIAGKIDKAQAEQTMLNFENLAALDRKISDEITDEDRVKMVNLMLQKQKIQQRMSELDESQKAIPNPALEIIDKQIGEIVTRTETKVKEQQQYDQENETGIPSEIREGQEPITTQPVEGASDQATPTSGVVQEEQAELEQVRQRISKIQDASGRGEILEDSQPGELGRLKKREEELSSKYESEEQQKESKKADIERRRQAELNYWKDYLDDNEISGPEKDAELITKKDAINARYDAELSKLETTPTEPQKITSVMTTGETQVESDLIGTDVSTGKQLKTADIQTGEMTSEFREDKNPTKGTVVNVEADPKNKNIERLILEDGTVLNRNKNTGAITLNNKVKATTKETDVKTETAVANEFDELADINKLPLAKRTKAKNAFSEKYGDKADKIIKIDSNFTSIVSKLESQKLITKKNC